MNQNAFTRALLRPDLPTPADIIAPEHDSATRRFAVYRNNLIASLSDALEIALRQAYHAADNSGDAAVTLSTYTPDQIAHARFAFAPAFQLIDSAYPIYDIWNKAHDPNYEITHQGQSIVILRPEFDPFLHLLSHAEHLFLRLMMDQSNLSDAAERASQQDPDFDLSQILQTLLTHNALEKVTQ
jgi:hypothetical protein